MYYYDTSFAGDGMYNQLQALQESLYRDIPLTRHLKLSLNSYDAHCLKIRAPLTENSNHVGTAFAGSLNSVVTLAGWSMLWLTLKELHLDGQIVIQDSTCNYLGPVTKDFYACCYKPDSEHIRQFEKVLKKKGKARLELHAEIIEDGVIRVSFKGRYVVQARQLVSSIVHAPHLQTVLAPSMG